MNETEYKAKLFQAMQSCTPKAVQNIKSALLFWPEKATGFGFDVFLDQDEEGFVSILITPDGPDSYVLNKAIREFRNLFEVKIVDRKVTFSLPLFDTGELDFSLSNAVSDISFIWVSQLVEQVGITEFPGLVRFTNCDHETKILR